MVCQQKIRGFFMDNLLDKIYNDIDFINIISDMINNPTVQEMKQYKQHSDVSCFDHCLLASYYCYVLCKKMHLDYVSCARAAMVHDLFLYDWHEHHPHYRGFHAFRHPQIAYSNASKIFNLNDKEADIILKHMWPVTFFRFPKYMESFILTLVDKHCAVCETMQNVKLYPKRALRYAYIFICLLFLHKS